MTAQMSGLKKCQQLIENSNWFDSIKAIATTYGHGDLLEIHNHINGKNNWFNMVNRQMDNSSLFV